MNAQRQAKEETVSEITEAFANVQSVVMADFRGVDVETVTAIRREFKLAGMQYRVLKNTLVKIAVKDDPKLSAMTSLLKGPTALMWSTESASAKRNVVTPVSSVKVKPLKLAILASARSAAVCWLALNASKPLISV